MLKFMRIALVLCLLGVVGAVAQAQGNDRPKWLVTPAISPDGEQIAFCYMGVLYTVPAGGGVATPLTQGKDYVKNPVWSPDGKIIAYASDRFGNFDIFTIPAQGGQPTRVTMSSYGEVPQTFNPSGDSIVFRANYMPNSSSARFYTGWNAGLFRVAANGGGTEELLSHPALNANYSPDGKTIIFEDVRGNEDPFRKHHTSSIARDIWTYNLHTRKLNHLVEHAGEDRQPRFTPDGKQFYFLSERDGGSFNVYLANAESGEIVQQVTQFEKNPVRYLSVANTGKLCFRYDGEIYTKDGASSPAKRLDVTIRGGNDELASIEQTLRSGAHDGVISPDGKEVAFVVRGDIYVANIKHGDTKRITNTPWQERSPNWNPDGRTLVYASEHDGTWNLHTATITRKDEPCFSLCTEITDEPLLQTAHTTFQPIYAPNGHEVAFLEDRTKIRVIDTKTKAVRDITTGHENFSYSDGDISYSWSPDSKWITLSYNALRRWPNSDIGLVSAKGGEKIINLTNSGYTDEAPKFMMNGDMIIWASDRNGYRSHASWGAQSDVYAFFTTKEAYDKYNMSQLEVDEIGDAKKKDEDDDQKDKEKKGKKGKKAKGDEKKDEVKPIKIDLNNIEDRIVRLTIHSSSLADAVVTPDGKSLYYLCAFEGKYNLWKTDLRERSTKKVLNLNSPGGAISLDKKGKSILISAGGSLTKVELGSEKQTRVAYAAPFDLRPAATRSYIFHHAWQQVLNKFYRKDLHGVDWKYYRAVYEKFLPHINNNYDFADMLSELLGELNASHTGSGYRGTTSENPWHESSLGLFFDRHYSGKGVRVTEVLRGGPFDLADSKVKAGTILTSLGGETLNSYFDLPKLLNRKRGERLRVDFTTDGTKGSEVVKPISLGAVSELMYRRWVEQRRAEVARLSGGRLGYVHIRSMNGASFHDVYSQLFGLENDKEGVVVDTRYNGGGHMHEDIEVLFSGKKYLDLVPRDHWVSEHPRKRWKKPSIMLISEANYSNAHGTPWVYKNTGIGKLVGQPVPGTMTSVWWEFQIDPTIYFGVPIVGYVDRNGNYLENQQLNPDIPAELDYQRLEQGHDSQIEVAVKELLKECDAFKANSPWEKIQERFQ